MYICCLQSLSLSKRKTTHLYICCKLSLLCTHHYEAIHHLLLDREEIIPCTEGQCCHLEEKTQFNQQPQRGTALFDLCVLLYSSRGGGLCWGIPPTLQWNVPQGCASPGKISGGKKWHWRNSNWFGVEEEGGGWQEGHGVFIFLQCEWFKTYFMMLTVIKKTT